MIRPIDLQDNYSKAPLAAREQALLQVRPEQTQHNIARQQAQEHVLDHSRIHTAEDADAAENRVDDHEGRQQQQGRRAKKDRAVTDKKEAGDNEAPPPRLNSAHFIDITV
jgi:hypothetical protein